MEPITYEFDETAGVWLIRANGITFTTRGFVDYIWYFFVSENLAEADDDRGSILGKNYENLYLTESQVVTGKEVDKKTKIEKIIKTPMMSSSWVRIILDFAQSAAYCRTERKLTLLAHEDAFDEELLEIRRAPALTPTQIAIFAAYNVLGEDTEGVKYLNLTEVSDLSTEKMRQFDKDLCGRRYLDAKTVKEIEKQSTACVRRFAEYLGGKGTMFLAQ